MKTTTILLLLFAITVNAQSIEKFSIDSGGDLVTGGGIEILYTIGETNVQELSVGNILVSEGFISANFEIQIDPKAFLQGPLLNPATAGLMNDDLRSGAYLPTTSPYSDLATVNPSVFTVTGNNAIVDWVWVELRAANDNTKLINGKSALLQRDGDIVALDGVSNLLMSAAPTNYFVVVKHRNHLGVMSSATFGLVEASATAIDFKSNAVSTFGSNAQVALNSGDMALWAGNVNGDSHIQYSGALPDSPSILSFILNNPSNFLNLPTFLGSGYSNYDIDLNGTIQYTGATPDTPFILQNVLAHSGNFLNLSTYQILEQLPEN